MYRDQGPSIKEQILSFDLNQLFNLSYSFDTLKKIIEKLAIELDAQGDRFWKEINSLKNGMNGLSEKFDGLKPGADLD